jgi:dipeptidyl aminopeptidase/acylaminoacyl peptidase
MRKAVTPFVLSLLTLVAVVALVTSSSASFPGPDGLISFARFSPKGNSEIYIARPDGSGVQKLTSNPRHFSVNSDWSPNGQLIAFDSTRVDVEGRKNVSQIYLMGADGTKATRDGRRTAPGSRSMRTGAAVPFRESGSFPRPTRTASPKPRLSG